MTDEQIIKSLRCWTGQIVKDEECAECSFGEDCSLGEIVDAAEKRLNELKSENAVLCERLEKKAVELPCRVGDKVYCIHRMSNPEMLEWQVNEIRITDHNYMLQLGRAGTKDYRNEASQFYGKWWFTELEAAEARLTELKGGTQ